MTFLGDKLDGLRHLLLQPGPHFRPLWRGRLAVELQLFLLQQEDEEDCPLHLQGPLPVQSGRFRETRPVLLVSTVLRQKFTYKSLKLFFILFMFGLFFRATMTQAWDQMRRRSTATCTRSRSHMMWTASATYQQLFLAFHHVIRVAGRLVSAAVVERKELWY
jgi:hypothetical protein